MHIKMHSVTLLSNLRYARFDLVSIITLGYCSKIPSSGLSEIMLEFPPFHYADSKGADINFMYSQLVLFIYSIISLLFIYLFIYSLQNNRLLSY